MAAPDKRTPGTVSRLDAASHLNLLGTRQKIAELQATEAALRQLTAESGGETRQDTLLPISKFAFAKGALHADRKILCPLHTGHAEQVFNAQAKTFGIPAPPSQADEHGWHASLSHEAAIELCQRQVQELIRLADALDTNAARQEVISSPGHALHVLLTGAEARNVHLNFADALVEGSSASGEREDLDEGDLFSEGLLPPEDAARVRAPRPTSAAPAPGAQTKPLRGAAWEARVAELERAEAEASYEEVWGETPPLLPGAMEPSTGVASQACRGEPTEAGHRPGPHGELRQRPDGTVDIVEDEAEAVTPRMAPALQPPTPAAGLPIEVRERAPAPGESPAPSAPRSGKQSLFRSRLRRG